MSFDVHKIRKDFPNLNVKIRGKDLVYLDNAATTFKPKAVIDAIDRHYRHGTSNIHRGVHYLSEQATAQFEWARAKVRVFINAAKSSEIIFTRGATEAINLVAFSYGEKFLKAGDEILISEMEHHSNIVPWKLLCERRGCILKIIPFDDSGTLDLSAFKRLLTDKTKFVSIVYISNSLGTINPVEEIISAAHSRNIPVLIDAAQAVNHRPVDVTKLDCDFLVFSAHKLYGPTGVGVLYGKEKLLEQMPPYQGGGDMIASVDFEKITYNVLPHKFEAGTPDIAGVIGLGSAVEYVQGIGMSNIDAHEKDLLHYGTEKLKSIDGLKLIGTAQNKAAVLSFTLPDIHPHDLGTLIDQEGVAIRTGHHCTQPVMKHFKIPATSRASLAMYNLKEDIDALHTAIIKARKIFA